MLIAGQSLDHTYRSQEDAYLEAGRQVRVLNRAQRLTFVRVRSSCRAHTALRHSRLHQVQSVNPNVTLLFYLNGLIDFPNFWRIANVTRGDPQNYYLYDAAGEQTLTVSPFPTFDMSKADMRQLFVNDCVYAVSSGVFQGCFIDRAK